MRISIDQIVQFVQVPQLIKDPLICEGKLKVDKRERPIHYSGGYAVVFPCDVNGNIWAFRCWSADLENIGRRLKIISKDLKEVGLPYFCDFTYVPEGIILNGHPYPTTRMKWIDGLNLKDYLCKNKNNSRKILNLAESFITMCMQLHVYHIAHGDLQHGNIMVDKDGNLFLIDYDSIFVSSMKDEKDIIAGLPDYQHPSRKNNILASEKLDYFSELIIYISILAIAEDPDFITKYKVEDNDRLLFKKEDFINIKESEIYQQLEKLGDKFQVLLSILEDYLKHNDINELTPFEDKISDSKYVTSSNIPVLLGRKLSENSKSIIYQKSDDKNIVVKIFTSNSRIGPNKENKIKYFVNNKISQVSEVSEC